MENDETITPAEIEAIRIFSIITDENLFPTLG